MDNFYWRTEKEKRDATPPQPSVRRPPQQWGGGLTTPSPLLGRESHGGVRGGVIFSPSASL